MRNYYLSLITLAATLLIICNPCKGQIREKTTDGFKITDKPQIDTQKLKKILLKTGSFEDLRNKIFPQEITVDQYINHLSKKSGPINFSDVHTYDTLFEWCYKEGLNPGINQIEYRVKWNILKNYIGYDAIKTSSNAGIGLYYVVDTSYNQQALTYVLAKAVIIDDLDTIIPVSLGGKYLILTNSSPYYREINSVQFNDYLNYYRLLQLRHLKNGNLYNISNLNHTQICFHPGDSLYRFFEDNKGFVQNQTYDDLYLTVRTGSTGPEAFVDGNKVTHNLLVQTPLLIFQENGTVFLDNFSYEGRNQGAFSKKALDIGRLCPPRCKATD